MLILVWCFKMVKVLGLPTLTGVLICKGAAEMIIPFSICLPSSVAVANFGATILFIFFCFLSCNVVGCAFRGW